MASYFDLYNLSQDEAFQKRVIYACYYTSIYILGEDPNVPFHNERLIWAKKVLSNTWTTSWNEASVRVAATGTIQQKGSDCSDADIQYQVDYLVNSAFIFL